MIKSETSDERTKSTSPLHFLLSLLPDIRFLFNITIMIILVRFWNRQVYPVDRTISGTLKEGLPTGSIQDHLIPPPPSSSNSSFTLECRRNIASSVLGSSLSSSYFISTTTNTTTTTATITAATADLSNPCFLLSSYNQSLLSMDTQY